MLMKYILTNLVYFYPVKNKLQLYLNCLFALVSGHQYHSSVESRAVKMLKNIRVQKQEFPYVVSNVIKRIYQSRMLLQWLQLHEYRTLVQDV